MIIKSKEMPVEIKKEMRGGTGEVKIIQIVQKEQLKNARLMAKLILEPGSSIGLHEHLNEVEYFIILKGKGLVNDNGIEKTVEAQDVIITGDGAKHSITNSGKETLELIAVIILN